MDGSVHQYYSYSYASARRSSNPFCSDNDERAFEIARAGKCANITELDQNLQGEGYKMSAVLWRPTALVAERVKQAPSLSSERPAFGLHKMLQGEPSNAEMIADVGDSSTVWPQRLHRHDRCIGGGGPRDHERVSVFSTLQNLPLFDVLLEMWNREDLRHERTFCASGRREQGAVLRSPGPAFIRRAVFDLAQRFPR